MTKPSTSRPNIEKQGTISVDYVETTPFVFRDTLYRLEWARGWVSCNPRKVDHLRIVNQESRETVSEFGDGLTFPSAMVCGDTVYVSGTQAGQQVHICASRDLKTWQTWPALGPNQYRIYNTSLCQADGEFVMSFEIDQPTEETGVPYTARFARSKDLKTWTITAPECNYSKDRYTAPHMLRYHDGWFYLFYLEAVADPINGNRDGMRYEQCVVRSKDFINWESSPLNPVLAASAEDKIIANPRLDAASREKIAAALDCNNSDIDVCEYRGQVIINYSWGNQTGIEFLATAVYKGTLTQFLTAWFPGR